MSGYCKATMTVDLIRRKNEEKKEATTTKKENSQVLKLLFGRNSGV